ncbi:MAG: hypothetical protein EOO63_16285, partial [Hymenobacter sp.]
MSLTYTDWNKLIAGHLFKPSRRGQEVFLYLTEEDLPLAVRAAAEKADTPLATPLARLAECGDGEIVADFWRAVRNGPRFWKHSPGRSGQQVYWVSSDARSGRRERLAPANPAQSAFYAYQDWLRPARNSPDATGRSLYCEVREGEIRSERLSVPLHLLYLLCFTMPFSTAQPEGYSGFYETWQAFFQEKGLLARQAVFPKNAFQQLGEGVWPALWEEIARWSREELGGECGVLVARQLGGYTQVGWPRAQCLLPPAVLNRLPVFFAHHRLLPGSIVPPGKMRDWLIQNNVLHLP